ncbi:NAD(P)/FAD-dependent oxidoreductase [Corticicoccus populi]|uniref:NAD(P)/FAD-dependent oxidoreductase n=1 Tax=Corticicoccus populi TaxID=1812821 RepID=A0ABW5WYD9_9STAP
MRDVVVVGAGLAGLSAAWKLQEYDIEVIEYADRTGGRIHSEKRGDYWLNWGGHVYAGEGSATDNLFKSVGVSAEPVPGTLSAMSLNGKLLLNGRVEFYPFRVPMSWKSRISLLFAGAKVRLAVMKYGKAAEHRKGETYFEYQQRILEFMNDKTFSEFTGDLPEDADAIFRPTVSRSTGNPEEISAGAGIGYFHMIWNKKEGLSRNIIGGPSVLTEKISGALGERLKLSAKVERVVQYDNYVSVTYIKDGERRTIEAEYVIMATPAPITKLIVENFEKDLSQALGEIKYGPHVSAAFLTDETDEQVWDDVYAFATPKRSFDIFIHSSNIVHSKSSERKQGSTFMTFSPAARGRHLLDKTDEEILEMYLKDLNEILPGFEEKVIEAKVEKFPLGSAYVYPGRAGIQACLTENKGRIFLAGDYLGTLYTETAVQTGFKASDEIEQLLERK